MENFRQKAILVAGGYMTKAPTAVTYASVVSCVTVCISLTIAALNDLQMKCSDILNAYIAATFIELIWNTLGLKCGDDKGKTAIFVRALYGLKSTVTAFRKHIEECICGLGYKPFLVDPDTMVFSTTPTSFVMLMTSWFSTTMSDLLYTALIRSSIGNPAIYLGAKLKRVQMSNDVWCWYLSLSKYVQEAVQNCQNNLKENYSGEYELIANAPNSFPLGDEPDMDVSLFLSPEEASYYHTIIGVMR